MGSFVTGGSSEGKPKVLIVDDEVQLAQTLSDILKLRGFDPDTAHDGLQAKKKLMSESFRIVITDIRMPRMDGSTLLAYIQEHHPRTSVILISGFAEVHDPSPFTGAAAVLQKPFRVRELADLVQKITAGSGVPG